MMIDFLFIELYVKKTYDVRLEDYYNVSKALISRWRTNEIPESRLNEFLVKEKSFDIQELFDRIYKN